MTQRIRTNCPRDCYDGCGVVVETSGATPVRVLGDPDHPVTRGRLCSKCAVAYNGVWQDPGARLGTPLRRTGAKGSGKFVPVSWDEALTETAARLNDLIAARGGDAVLHTHYSGTLALLGYLFPGRLFTAIGASEVDPDTICNAAGHAAWSLLFGTSAMGFDPRTAKDSRCILVWGANPSHSAPHAHEHWLPESPGTVIVVDPVRTETAVAADLHLQPRPGTDAALAFSLLHVMRAEGLIDADFVAGHTVGFDEIEADIDRATAAWGEAKTGVPAALIGQAARLYAPGPSLLWCGQGLQRQTTGGNVMRAVGLLPALTGNVGKPGAGFYYLNVTPALAGIDLGYLAGAGLGHGGKTVGHMELAARLAGDEFGALVAWNTNPAASAPDQRRLRAALERDDLFTVVVDCFLTDTARFADIVLPAAGFLEYDDLTFSYFHLNVGAQVKVTEPPGDALPNTEIFRRLARAMNLEEPALFEADRDMIDRCMAQLNDAGEVGGPLDFDALKARGFVTIGSEPMPMFADHKFPTPSGRIEIASARAEADGLPRTPQPWADDAPAADHLRLLTPASKWRLNDSYGNDPHLVEQAGPATVHLNAYDASRFGVADGARVRVWNETGAIELIAAVDDAVGSGTALTYKGRWPALEDGVNPNFLHAPEAADMGNSTSVHSTMVRIEPAGRP